MDRADIPDFASLTTVELDAIVGDVQFLLGHPAIRQVETGKDGRLTLWVDQAASLALNLSTKAPDRLAEVELCGRGRPSEALVLHPRAEHVEIYVDAMGDPEHAPHGWWHALIWLRPLAPQALVSPASCLSMVMP